MDLLGWLRKHLEEADCDLLCEPVTMFVQALTGAGPMRPAAPRSPEEVNQRNGDRPRRLNTRVGILSLVSLVVRWQETEQDCPALWTRRRRLSHGSTPSGAPTEEYGVVPSL
jgi:hypothetical protein